MEKKRIAAAVLSGTLAVAGTGIAGCGGAPPPTRTQADAQAAVRSAEAVGAAETPQAAYHLALADEQMRTAQQLIRVGRMDAAERVLERAKADAELAVSLAQEDDARQQAEQVRQHIETLEREQR